MNDTLARAVRNLPPLAPDARMGRWPAWGPMAKKAIKAALRYINRDDAPMAYTALKHELNIILYCDLPCRAELGKRRPGAERGFRDPRHIAHTPGYLQAYLASGGKETGEAEHMVPMSLVCAMLDATAGDPELVRNVLSRYYKLVRVTKEDHAKLAKAGLKSRMPADWRPGDPAEGRYAQPDVCLPILPPQEQWQTDLTDEELDTCLNYK